MPSEKSAKVSQRRFVRNRSVRRALRTSRTKVERAINEALPESEVLAHQTIQEIDKARSKNVIHKNKAARLKSRLAKKVNSLSNSPS